MAEQGLSMGRHRIRTLMRLNGLRPTWRRKFVHTTDSQHVLDLHSRKVVGWATSPAVPAGLVCAALQMAIVQRNPAPGLVVHSDRGTQYASAEHQGLLSKHGLVGSMGRKGNCWDDAVMERVWHQDYANHLEATSDIADYIVGFYNSIRLHSNLGNMSPNAFEREPTSKKPSVLSEII